MLHPLKGRLPDVANGTGEIGHAESMNRVSAEQTSKKSGAKFGHFRARNVAPGQSFNMSGNQTTALSGTSNIAEICKLDQKEKIYVAKSVPNLAFNTLQIEIPSPRRKNARSDR